MEEAALQQAIAKTKLEKEAECIQCIRQAIAETNASEKEEKKRLQRHYFCHYRLKNNLNCFQYAWNQYLTWKTRLTLFCICNNAQVLCCK